MGSGRLRGVRVLVMEADDAERRGALTALAGEDALVTPVATVSSAIAFSFFTPPDIVLADLTMEEDGGWRLLEALRKRPAAAAIPVIAACESPDDGEAALHSGFAAYVLKPFAVETLRAIVARVAIARVT